jgi:hypothetical protein
VRGARHSCSSTGRRRRRGRGMKGGGTAARIFERVFTYMRSELLLCNADFTMESRTVAQSVMCAGPPGIVPEVGLLL